VEAHTQNDKKQEKTAIDALNSDQEEIGKLAEASFQLNGISDCYTRIAPVVQLKGSYIQFS
jgi:protein involved in temperature-dependent protein secretion